MSPRWRKLAGDLRATWGRLVVLLLATTLALTGLGIALAGRVVLGREIAASYRATLPADATLELPGGVDAALLAEVRARPEVADADARSVLAVRVRTRADLPWQPLVLYVVEDLAAVRLARFWPAEGAWPPPRGALLVERMAPAVMGIAPIDRVIVKTPHGREQTVEVAGTVHDPGQAPAWQEHRGYAYATRETLGMLGEPAVLDGLLVRFRTAASQASVEDQARALAAWLRERGRAVHEIRVPALRRHPHQGLMNAVQVVMLVFSLVLLVLAAIVVATVLSAILARQTREIGVMKAIGARAGQLAVMYGSLVVGLGVIAAAIAVPLARVGANGMIAKIGAMMNITLADPAIPVWVLAVVAIVGVLVPLGCAAFPIVRAARISVRRALAPGDAAFARPSRLPLAVRNALRKPGRLAFTMVLLVVGGTLVVVAANVQRGMMEISVKLEDARHYDLEIRLHEPITFTPAVPGVTAIEAWGAARASIGDIVRTYPDGGHGSFLLVAPPPGGTRLVDYPLQAGAWPAPEDDEGVVLGHNAMRGVAIGARITLVVAGRPSTWTVRGIVEEVGGGSAFVSDAAFRRVTGIAGAKLLRVAAPDRERVLAALERELAARGASVELVLPTGKLRSIIDDHVVLVVRAVIVMAAILALVGLVGLASAMAINVAERTREIGVMKAIGASDRRIFAIVVGEGLLVGLASAVLAVVLALPLTWLAGARIGTSFLATPPFAIAWPAVAGLPIAIAFGSVVASLVPARRAVRLTVREAIAEV